MNENSFIAQLRDVRSNLQDAMRAADHLENKFVGPRPAESAASTPQKTQESIGSLLSDINGLSVRLTKMLAHQHEIVGDFAGAQADCTPARYA